MFAFNNNSKSIIQFFMVLLLSVITANSFAATQKQKLIASNGAAEDLFGSSVSISGTYAVVGMNHTELDNSVFGAAYVYEYDGTNWIEKAILTPPAPSENFGVSVSISGDRIIVGAPYAIIDGQQFTGAVYIYHRDINGSWNFIEKETASDHAFNDRFGSDVAIDGNQFIVGATQNDEVVNGSGAVYVFDYINNSWDESQTLLASNPLLNDHFGVKVQIENNRLIVGAPDADDSTIGANTGKVYVFEKIGAGGTWVETHIFTAESDMATGDLFGNDISLSGDRVVVGASANSDDGNRSGSAYVFQYDPAMGSWDTGQKLTAFDAAAFDLFGIAVSMNGDKMLIGATGNDETQNNSGSVYSYYHDGNSWVYIERILHTDSPSMLTDELGGDIDFDGDLAIFGSQLDDADGTGGLQYNSGAAYIFDIAIAPVAVDDSSNTIEDSGIIFISVTNNDTDTDGGPKFIESFTQSNNGTVGTAVGRLSYKPDSDYCNDGNTTDNFTYTLNGGSVGTVSITVNCVNDLPEAVEDYINVYEDSNSTIIDVLDNDFDVDGGGDEILIASITNAANGTVNFTSTQLTYQPDANYCNKSSTLDYFTYTLTTGSTTDVAVRVSCINDKPSFQVVGDIQANQGLLTNATEYNQMGFANSFVFGPDNESAQGVQQFNVSEASDSSDVINSIDILDDGTLQIDFTLNQGVAIIEVSLQDNGGTSDGGIDSSDTLTFNIAFIDRVFSSGFEETIITKSSYLSHFLEKNHYINSEWPIPIFDSESQSILYKNHLFELSQLLSFNEIVVLVNQWIHEVNISTK